MACLDNIVTLRDKCSQQNAEPISGYDLMDAPEISPLGLSDAANEKYVDGYTMARRVLNNAVTDIKNDFLAVLSANNISAYLNSPSYTTSDFNGSATYPAQARERGLTLYRNPAIRGRMKRVVIKKVSVMPAVDVEGAEILIYDDNNVYTYPTVFTGGVINTVRVDHLMRGNHARVLVDGSNMPVHGSSLTCFIGCGGKVPNECGYTKGYNGTNEVNNKEGFGVGVEFSCECDYDGLLCDLSKSYVGKLIWLKARIGLLNERIFTNRNNNWIAYGKEEAQLLKDELGGEYTDAWNAFAVSLPNVLGQYRDECLSCNSVQWKTNI